MCEKDERLSHAQVDLGPVWINLCNKIKSHGDISKIKREKNNLHVIICFLILFYDYHL